MAKVFNIFIQIVYYYSKVQCSKCHVLLERKWEPAVYDTCHVQLWKVYFPAKNFINKSFFERSLFFSFIFRLVVQRTLL